jgi:hypothetical protein
VPVARIRRQVVQGTHYPAEQREIHSRKQCSSVASLQSRQSADVPDGERGTEREREREREREKRPTAIVQLQLVLPRKRLLHPLVPPKHLHSLGQLLPQRLGLDLDGGRHDEFIGGFGHGLIGERDVEMVSDSSRTCMEAMVLLKMI